ncbi:hypothetical protein D3C83_112220 [compost metagenome]
MRRLHRCHGAGNRHAGAACNAEGHVVLRVTAIVFARIADRLDEQRRLVEDLVERETRYILAAHFKQVLGCGIHVTYRQCVVHQHDRSGKQFQAR